MSIGNAPPVGRGFKILSITLARNDSAVIGNESDISVVISE